MAVSPSCGARAFRALLPAFVAALALAAAPAASATVWTVAPWGDDGGAGSAADPWQTLQKAADEVAAGDTVVVLAGDYAGFDLRTSGTSAAWIRFVAEPGARVVAPNGVTPDGINVENAAHVAIEGFTVEGIPRNGIRAVVGHHVTIRGNRVFDSGSRGILTGFVDDLLIAGNETAGTVEEHGIYVSNSGDRPVVRGNLSWGNHRAGIHINGDLSAGGDGVISDALVEGNVLLDNGLGGAAGINCDGVRDSVLRNNLILGNHATGIALYRIDGGAPSTGNLVVHNTIVMAEDGRWGITVRDGSGGNTLRNNIVLTRHPWRGALDVEVATGSHLGLVSDHNVLADRFTPDGGDTVLDLAAWRADYGLDLESSVAGEAELFVDPDLPDGDYHLKAGSPAIDAGTAEGAPARDLDGDVRPIGPGFDAGADEAAPPCTAADTVTLADDTVTGVELHTACHEIVAGPAYTVAGSGELTLRARHRVRLAGGFAVAAGGRLELVMDPAAGAP